MTQEEQTKIVCAIVRSIYHHPQDADDLRQHILLSIQKKLKKKRQKTNYDGLYIYRGALRDGIRWIQKRRKQLKQELPLDGIDVQGKFSVEAIDARIDVAYLMEKLNEEQRVLIRWKYFDGKTLEEMAQEIGWTISKVRRGLRKCLKLMSEPRGK